MEKDEECRELFMDYPLPCSYRDYCSEYMKMVTQETLEAIVWQMIRLSC